MMPKSCGEINTTANLKRRNRLFYLFIIYTFIFILLISYGLWGDLCKSIVEIIAIIEISQKKK